jgi:hypothetical protein
MQTTYRLHAHELTEDFLVGLKTLFPDKPIQIVVSELPESADEPTLHKILGLPADEPLNESTVYLFGNEANRRHLLKEMEEARRGENIVSFSIEEFENLR